MSLAPEHLDDLYKSGLSEQTIVACKFATVEQDTIHLSGVKSAYKIPYFDFEGQVINAERWKLVPPLVRSNGTQKYHQPKDSHPNIYLPPLCDWAAIASDSQRTLIITEGEKKAAALSQHGIPTIGIAGCWSYRQRDGFGGRLTIPAFDQFAWKHRVVELIPDSDVWRAEKQQALNGFNALAMELISRGGRAHFIVLPEHCQCKVGIDDWLVRVGTQREEHWPLLPRIALDDRRLLKVAKWWQGWREKPVLEDARRQSAQEHMEVTDLAGSVQIKFPTLHVMLEFNRVSEKARVISGELTVSVDNSELLGTTDIELKSDSSRDRLARSLSQTAKHLPWKRLVERACAEVLKHHRRGEPIIELQPADSIHTPFVMNPIVYRGHQTLIFAPGGSYKSYLSLYFALLAFAGLRQSGIAAVKTNVLYCDWELDAETVGARLKALHAGHPELAHVRPYYRRCSLPLHLETPLIVAEVVRLGVGLIIIDSAAMACGGELNAPEAAIKLQQALRWIGCASIVLAHVSKSTADGQGKSAYGSVFFRELARNVWELSRLEDSNRVVLSQTGVACKNSFGPKQNPLGFIFAFGSEQVQISSFNPAEEDESGFEDKLPLRDRIRRLLLDKISRSSREIADQLHASESSVKSTLSTHRQLFIRSGPYHKGTWTLTADAIAPNPSLKLIVEAPIVDTSLQSLNEDRRNVLNHAHLQGKQIVEAIVEDRCTPSLLKEGGITISPSSTINHSTKNNFTDSQPEEVIDLAD